MGWDPEILYVVAINFEITTGTLSHMFYNI